MGNTDGHYHTNVFRENETMPLWGIMKLKYASFSTSSVPSEMRCTAGAWISRDSAERQNTQDNLQAPGYSKVKQNSHPDAGNLVER